MSSSSQKAQHGSAGRELSEVPAALKGGAEWKNIGSLLAGLVTWSRDALTCMHVCMCAYLCMCVYNMSVYVYDVYACFVCVCVSRFSRLGRRVRVGRSPLACIEVNAGGGKPEKVSMLYNRKVHLTLG